jgi:hypothetical protein
LDKFFTVIKTFPSTISHYSENKVLTEPFQAFAISLTSLNSKVMTKITLTKVFHLLC